MEFAEEIVVALLGNSFISRGKVFYRVVVQSISHILWAVVQAFPFTFVGAIKRLRFLIRCVFYARASVMWFSYIRQSELRHATKFEPSLLEAVHRPFFDRRLSALERACLLRDNFELMRRNFTQEHFQSLLFSKKVEVLKLTGKKQEVVQVHLVRNDAYKREGGATLIMSFNGDFLLSLTFSLAKSVDGVAFKVGGIQSGNCEGRQKIKLATVAMHGIQPRLLLIEVLRTIGQQLNCNNIECISLENHIYQAWRYRFKKSVSAEYNQLWELAGGGKNASGNYAIPTSLVEKSIDERPSNKRSEYRRRALLIAELRDQVQQALGFGDKANSTTLQMSGLVQA
ncbi:VirK/YbjX family protein [Undibacterium flavidum]|uniref:DUF535 family protein n=1 Tax=Undibacterium flavidum TaxID=2762297 RepID=A0ABR6YCU8_9BURK|nr:DUF535 family protein [Undibacterium flavidum]MBC3874375.1 DUF535 family protein [Undibacterium flavidum]